MQQDAVLPDKTHPTQDCIDSEIMLKILEKHRDDYGGLIAILEDIQGHYGYLPEKTIRLVSEKTHCSLVDIYGVATFYRFFSLQPKGKHLICACLGTACHVRGAPRVVAELEQQLGIKSGQTTPDKEFTLETVNCLGACALGPVVVIDGRYFSKVKRSKIAQLLDEARKGFGRLDTGKDERIFPISVNCPHCGRSFEDKTATIDGHPALKFNGTLDGKQGWIRLSCLYGSSTVSTEFDIPEGAVVNFLCPHCGAAIYGDQECIDCGAPMISMPVSGGAVVQICSRRGCKNHMLDIP